MADTTDPTGGNELDYAYAPVGLFCLTFWTSALLVGLVGFAVTIITAKGIATVVHHEENGIFDGLGVFAVTLILSILMGFTGRSMVLKRKNIDTLWKLAYAGIPIAMAALTVAALAVHN